RAIVTGSGPSDHCGAAWQIWCPDWWPASYPIEPIRVGRELEVPVGFTVDDGWRVDRSDGPATVERVGPGSYAVERAPFRWVTPDPGGGDRRFWGLAVGDLDLVVEGWHPKSSARALRLETGDRLSGRLELSVDPIIEVVPRRRLAVESIWL